MIARDIETSVMLLAIYEWNTNGTFAEASLLCDVLGLPDVIIIRNIYFVSMPVCFNWEKLEPGGTWTHISYNLDKHLTH